MKTWKKIFVLSFSLLVLTACGKIQMKDYVDVEFFGPNGDGVAVVNFDEDRFVSDVVADAKRSNFIDQYRVYDSIKYEVDKKEGLKNGDTVTVNFEYTDKHKKIKTNPLKVKVKDLVKPTKVSIKEIEDQLELEFKGVSGFGTLEASFKSEEEPYSRIEMEVENNGNLKNGDKAVIKLDLYVNQITQTEFYELEKDQIEVEVKGLEEVPKKLSSVGNLDNFKKIMKEEIVDDYNQETFKVEYLNLYYREKAPENPSIVSKPMSWSSDNYEFGEIAYLVKVTTVDGFYKGDVKHYIYSSGGNTISDNKLSLNKAQTLTKNNFPDSYSLDSIELIIEEDGFELVE